MAGQADGLPEISRDERQVHSVTSHRTLDTVEDRLGSGVDVCRAETSRSRLVWAERQVTNLLRPD